MMVSSALHSALAVFVAFLGLPVLGLIHRDYITELGDVIVIAKGRTFSGVPIDMDTVGTDGACIELCLGTNRCEGVGMLDMVSLPEIPMNIECFLYANITYNEPAESIFYAAYMPGKKNVTKVEAENQQVKWRPYVMRNGRTVYLSIYVLFVGEEIPAANGSYYFANNTECIESCSTQDGCRGVSPSPSILWENRSLVTLCPRFSHIRGIRFSPDHVSFDINPPNQVVDFPIITDETIVTTTDVPVEIIVTTTDVPAETTVASSTAPEETGDTRRRLKYRLPSGRELNIDRNAAFDGVPLTIFLTRGMSRCGDLCRMVPNCLQVSLKYEATMDTDEVMDPKTDYFKCSLFDWRAWYFVANGSFAISDIPPAAHAGRGPCRRAVCPELDPDSGPGSVVELDVPGRL